MAAILSVNLPLKDVHAHQQPLQTKSRFLCKSKENRISSNEDTGEESDHALQACLLSSSDPLCLCRSLLQNVLHSL